MKKEDLKVFEDMNIKIILKNNYQYNGYIKKLSDENLLFEDKYESIILISYDDIKLIKENRDVE